MAKKKVEFKLGDVVRVAVHDVLSFSDVPFVYGLIEKLDLEVGYNIPGEDQCGPYFLINGVCGRTAIATSDDMSMVTCEDLDGELSKLEAMKEKIETSMGRVTKLYQTVKGKQ